MILVAVVIGYILGVAPFITPKIIEIFKSNKVEEQDEEKQKEQNEIFNEWLNGPTNKVNQEDLYKEYITGNETVGKGE